MVDPPVGFLGSRSNVLLVVTEDTDPALGVVLVGLEGSRQKRVRLPESGAGRVVANDVSSHDGVGMAEYG